MRKHKVRRKKMYIRRVIAVVFFLAALILASLRSGPLVYALLYLSILLPLFSALYTVYVYRRMCVVQLIDNHFAVKNEPVEYTCRLVNETSSAFTRIQLVPLSDLSEIIDFDGERIFNLAPGESEDIHSPVICRRRGLYSIGIDRILITDILGLMTFSFKPPVEFRVTVYPRVLHLDSLGIFDLEGSKTRQIRSITESEPADTVRSYEPGDDPRMIHWKASAKTGSLKTRQLGAVEKPAITIILDTKKYSDDNCQIVREDNLLESLLAICDYCAICGIPVDIHAQDMFFSIRCYKDFRELYDWSCQMVFRSNEPDVTIPKILTPCCAFLTTGQNPSAVSQLELESASGTECVLMEFGQDSALSVSDNSRLKIISVPDECCIERLLA